MAGKFALLLGNDQFLDEQFGSLTVPGNDVKALKAQLENPAVGGFDQVDILLNGTLEKVMAAMGDLFANKNKDDLLLLYFSGHGALDQAGQLYLAVSQTQYNRLSSTGVSASFIKNEMNNSRSRRQVLIFDCCRSGAFGRDAAGAKTALGTEIMNESTFEVKGYGREILVSSSATQLSWEGHKVIDKTDKSLFTHFIVEGLSSGKAAAEGKHEITVGELYDYAYHKVVNEAANMTPQRWVDKQQGAIVIAKNPHPQLQPTPLPEKLLAALEDDQSFIREGAVRELGRLIQGEEQGLADAARKRLLSIQEKERDRHVWAVIIELLNIIQEKTPEKTNKDKESPSNVPVAGSTNGQKQKIKFAVFIVMIILAIVIYAWLEQRTKIEGCDFRLISVSNDIEQQKIILEFQSEFESKKNECVILIVHSTNAPNKWSIAGFNDEGLFRSVLIDAPSSELSVEQKKESANKIIIAKLAASKLGRTQINYSEITGLNVGAISKIITHPTIKSGKVFQDTLTDGTKGPKMVVIPAGSFMMGAPKSEAGSDDDERPQHQVKIAKSYAIGRYEVTVGQFKKFVQASGYQTEAEKSGGCYYYDGGIKKDKDKSWRSPGFQQDDQHPVVCVSWNDAQAYIKWLTEQTGKLYRLPSEAEWEYAARAGSATARYWGDKPDNACTYANVVDKTAKQKFGWSNIHACTDGYGYTAPTGQFAQNNFKLKDMQGNVWEWVQDTWHENYQGAPEDGTVWEGGDDSLRVLRGGSWGYLPPGVGAAYRIWSRPGGRHDDIGFRLAQDK